MRVLALDTALDACAAAVLDRAGPDLRLTAETDVIGRGHAERLMALLGGVMTRAGLGFADLDLVAVTVGPGSFTGIRVGVAVARGIALAAGKPIAGISTLVALAEDGRAAAPGEPVLAAIDARRGEVYAQAFAADGAPVSPPAAMALADAAALADHHGARLIGSGAPLLQALRPDLALAGSPRAFPAIETVAALALDRADLRLAPKPLYLRAADAKPQEGFRIARMPAAPVGEPGAVP